MAHNSTSGRTPGLSMAEFNARAKKIAASTGDIEKGDARRSPPSRFRRDKAAPRPETAEPAENAETAEAAESTEG
ncbi:hypothetical protein [Methylobacterium brachythecii]|uniref:Uncharacterized protein n=1 Tax=Methylobacterium brachythecii TaxID=1176177 RepID=A0A7W6AJ78_9HYPH|nr:hypothetical protein [Methylobacterium brachythecii]MBB3904362.1 hypothetical protein [Methylobacterium brachythecii]GLS46512.1 hypothetical protein GCM10007884_45060 [Methylobacterium brachythecii]